MQSWRLRPISANLFKMFFVKLPQNRHPERSASQIDCVSQCLWRGVEGPRRCLFYPCCLELFDRRARTGRPCLWLQAPALFEGYEDIRTAIAREKDLKSWRRKKKLNLIRTIHPEFKDLAQTCGWKLISVHEKIYP